VSSPLDPLVVALDQASAALEAGDALAARDAAALAARLCIQVGTIPLEQLALLRRVCQRCTDLAEAQGRRLAASLVEAGVSRRATSAYREAP
jgi:hypothetical protein